jgi:hypothetical protein
MKLGQNKINWEKKDARKKASSTNGSSANVFLAKNNLKLDQWLLMG